MRPDQARTIADIFEDEAIGSAIAKLRQNKALQNQTDFGAHFKLTREQLAFIETGRTPITAGFGWLLCKTFNCHPLWFMRAAMEEEPPKLDSITARNLQFLERKLRRYDKMPFREFFGLLGWFLDDNVKNITQSMLDNEDGFKENRYVKVKIHSLPDLLKAVRSKVSKRGQKQRWR